MRVRRVLMESPDMKLIIMTFDLGVKGVFGGF